MYNILKLCWLISLFLPGLSGASAQGIADSTIQKINGERAFYETLGKIYPPDSAVAVTETSIAGVKGYWFNEKRISGKQIVIYLHGGVYALGSINAYRAMLSHLAGNLQAPVLYIEYSLAPEHPFPAAANEILSVYRALRKKYPNYKISIVGDSAGGGLAISLVRDIQASNLPSPDALALLSPWVDLKCNNNSYTTKQAADPVLSRNMLYGHALLYAPGNLAGADPSEIRFKKFPPVLLLVGTDEVLNDDAKNFYAAVRPIQEKAILKEFDGQKHVWLISDIHSKASVAAMKDIKAFLNTEKK